MWTTVPRFGGHIRVYPGRDRLARMYTAAFSRFLADPHRLHFAAHSHHPWPDVARDAQIRAWDDAARWIDAKWSHVFDTVVPTAQRHIARQLNLPDPATVAFATNLHEFVLRLASAVGQRPMRVLTTDSEFHSFARQLERWEEAGEAVATRVPVEPFESFQSRWAEAAADDAFDFVYLSQTFFNSGFVVPDIHAAVAAVASEQALIAVDGYHSFMAFPVDWSVSADRAFFLAGGYKYAMAGEGACFMHCPPGWGERPVNTGWFAGFEGLSDAQQGVPYAQDAMRFAGSTFDPSALYRFNAVQGWLESQSLTPYLIHLHVESLQQQMLSALPVAGLGMDELIPPMPLTRGNFLTFRSPRAAQLKEALAEAGVVTDVRDDRLRFGFGIYHSGPDVVALVNRLSRC